MKMGIRNEKPLSPGFFDRLASFFGFKNKYSLFLTTAATATLSIVFITVLIVIFN